MSDEPSPERPDDPLPEDVRASLRIATEHMRRMSEAVRMRERSPAALGCFQTIPLDFEKASTAVTVLADFSSTMFDWPKMHGPLADTTYQLEVLLTERFKRLAASLIPLNFTNLLVDENLKRTQTIAEDAMLSVKKMIAESIPDDSNLVQLLSSQSHISGIDASVLSDAIEAQANVVYKFAEDMLRPQFVETTQVISNSLTALQAARDMAVRPGIPVEETLTLEQSVQEFLDDFQQFIQENRKQLLVCCAVVFLVFIRFDSRYRWDDAAFAVLLMLLQALSSESKHAK